ncbi:hypothetical protein KP509_10G081300 [Ceratopteris richardii]|uniref:Uncharacterized protein n=1 Tax=Ceratopteris richardii TaxID=49495 RepID=A0A8T2U0R3_CERRI|nr:hypothetical protein KP509_10G081300 [Ceratopteris richardii]
MSESVITRLSRQPSCLAILMFFSLVLFQQYSMIIDAADQQDETNADMGDDSACLKGFMEAFYVPHPVSDINGRRTHFTSWTAIALEGNPCTKNASANNLFGVRCNNGNRVESIALPSEGLVGEIPSTLSLCSSLTNLDLSSNGITGNLPTSLGNLANLVTLSLSNNQISGSIPLELSTCYALREIDLSNNSLSGPIPPQLGLLPLVEFNVSYNNLSGSIPFTLSNTSSGSPRFGITSFFRNPGLYGYPLTDEASESRKASSSQAKMNYVLLAITILFTVGVACCLILLCVLCAGHCQTCRDGGSAQRDLEQNHSSPSCSPTGVPVDGWKEVLNQLERSSS